VAVVICAPQKPSTPGHASRHTHFGAPAIQNGPCDLIEDFGVKAV